MLTETVFKPKYEISLYGIFIFTFIIGLLLIWPLSLEISLTEKDYKKILHLGLLSFALIFVSIFSLKRIIKQITFREAMEIDYVIGERIVRYEQIERFSPSRIELDNGLINFYKIKNSDEWYEQLLQLERIGAITQKKITVEELDKILLKVQSVIATIFIILPFYFLITFLGDEYTKQFPDILVKASIFLFPVFIYGAFRYVLFKSKTINHFLFTALPSFYKRIKQPPTHIKNALGYGWIVVRFVTCLIGGIIFLLIGIVNGFDMNPEHLNIRITLSIISIGIGLLSLIIAFRGWRKTN